MDIEYYDRHTPVKILYEARKKRQRGDVKENIKLYTGVIENTKGSGSKTEQQ